MIKSYSHYGRGASVIFKLLMLDLKNRSITDNCKNQLILSQLRDIKINRDLRYMLLNYMRTNK